MEGLIGVVKAMQSAFATQIWFPILRFNDEIFFFHIV